MQVPEGGPVFSALASFESGSMGSGPEGNFLGGQAHES